VAVSKPQARTNTPSAQRAVSALQLHPQSQRVPAMSEAEFAAFSADVAKRGILQPLEITAAGVVLDGRHRLRAAHELGKQTVPVQVVAPADPVEHMLRAALQRRHLGASQKAALALELDICQQERTRADRRRRANLKQHTEVATLPPRGARTRELAAQVAGVSPRTMQDVITVHAADRDLYEQIKAGTIHAHTARRQVERARRYAQVGKSRALPRGRFELIYARSALAAREPRQRLRTRAVLPHPAARSDRATRDPRRDRRAAVSLGRQLAHPRRTHGDGRVGVRVPLLRGLGEAIDRDGRLDAQPTRRTC